MYNFTFQGLGSLVKYYSFFLPSLLVFKRLVTGETLALNGFCGIVGKGRLLNPLLRLQYARRNANFRQSIAWN